MCVRSPVVLVFLLAVSGAMFGDDGGIPPRARRWDYFSTSFTESLGLAGTLLTAEQARHAVGADVESNYVVVELGFYPKAGEVGVGYADFAVRVRRDAAMIRPTDPANITGAPESVRRKAFPTRRTSHPVAGYLYFPKSQLGYGAACELDYRGNGIWLTLPLQVHRCP